jgi:hypothetical protein
MTGTFSAPCNDTLYFFRRSCIAHKDVARLVNPSVCKLSHPLDSSIRLKFGISNYLLLHLRQQKKAATRHRHRLVLIQQLILQIGPTLSQLRSPVPHRYQP